MISNEELYLMLDINNSQELQEQGIKIGLQCKNLEIFLQPYDKCIWENCAKILAQKTDEELEPYLPEILEWLQDLTWPGALAILERLRKFNSNMLIKDFEKAIKRAEKENDINWIYFLSHVLTNSVLNKNLSIECLNIIEKNNLEYY